MELHDKLTGALIGLARATDGNEHLISDSSTAVIVESLCATAHDHDRLQDLLKRVEDEKRKMVPNCFLCASPCGKNSDYDMQNLRETEDDIRSIKERILSGIREIAAQGCRGADIDRFYYTALIVIGMDGYTKEDLRPIMLEMEEIRQKNKFGK